MKAVIQMEITNNAISASAKVISNVYLIYFLYFKLVNNELLLALQRFAALQTSLDEQRDSENRQVC